MKKEYTKPIALIENFEVNEFIAGDCSDGKKGIYDVPGNLHYSLKDCEIDEGGTIYFASHCADLEGENVFEQSTCYQQILGAFFAS